MLAADGQAGTTSATPSGPTPTTSPSCPPTSTAATRAASRPSCTASTPAATAALRSASTTTSCRTAAAPPLPRSGCSDCLLNTPALRVWPLSVVCLFDVDDARRRRASHAMRAEPRRHPRPGHQRRLPPAAWRRAVRRAARADRRTTRARSIVDRPQLADMRGLRARSRSALRRGAPTASTTSCWPPTRSSPTACATAVAARDSRCGPPTAPWCARCATPGTSPTRSPAASPRPPRPPAGAGCGWPTTCATSSRCARRAARHRRAHVRRPLTPAAAFDTVRTWRVPTSDVVAGGHAPVLPAGRAGRTARWSCCCTGWRPTPRPGTARSARWPRTGYRVLALDLIGHGRSDKPPSAYLLDDFADVGARLPRRARHPRRRRCAGTRSAAPSRWHFGHRAPRPVERARAGLGRRPGPRGAPAAARGGAAGGARSCCGSATRAAAAPAYAHPRVHRALRLTPDNVTNLRRAGRALGHGRRAGGVLRVAARRDRARRPARVVHRHGDAVAAHVPTLLVWNEGDPVIPVAHARAAHEHLPGSRLVVFPGSGHEPHRRHAAALRRRGGRLPRA